jgi:hypothetical protein
VCENHEYHVFPIIGPAYTASTEPVINGLVSHRRVTPGCIKDVAWCAEEVERRRVVKMRDAVLSMPRDYTRAVTRKALYAYRSTNVAAGFIPLSVAKNLVDRTLDLPPPPTTTGAPVLLESTASMLYEFACWPLDHEMADTTSRWCDEYMDWSERAAGMTASIGYLRLKGVLTFPRVAWDEM